MPKLIVPAVPIGDPEFCTTTPEPIPAREVKPEPSPTKLVAVTAPETLTPEE